MDTTPEATPQVEAFPVAVLTMFRHPGGHAWDDGHWEVTGVVAGGDPGLEEIGMTQVRSESGETHYLWRGLALSLFRDEAASYYHNLAGEQPRVFVVCRRDEGGVLRPVITTLSYDEAASYTEVEEEVFSVPMPPEVYRWVEAFVLEHYVPEKRKKRKREDWKNSEASDPTRPGRA
jgi:hypothetical protein